MPAREKLPFLFVNMAMTADGKIASANRRISSFSSPRDRRHMLLLRARADAVMAGARTIDLNPVYLGPGGPRFRKIRVENGLAEFNLRIIVSGSGSINPKAAIFKRRFSPIIILTTDLVSATRLKRLRSLADEVKVCGATSVNFPDAFAWLQSKWNVKSILCEGGGELNSALVNAGLVHEIHLTICPNIFGGQLAPTICDGIGAPTLSAATQLQLKSMRRIGTELFLVYTTASPHTH